METARAQLARFVLLGVISASGVACSGSPSASPSPTPASIVCADAHSRVKTAGELTFGTTDPSYSPWFEGDPSDKFAIEPSGAPRWQMSDPYSMHGFESGVAYSLANAMGFEPDHVLWVPSTREAAVAPGQKPFDVYIGQVPAPTASSDSVDYSDVYLDSYQAVFAEPTNAISGAKTAADIKGFRLGVVENSTSARFVADVLKPDAAPSTYLDQVTAAAALRRTDIDGLVTDIATAFYLIDGPGGGVPAPMPDGTVVGKFAPSMWTDHLAMVLEKGNALTPCVNAALVEIKGDGSLDEFRTEDIPVGEDVPTLQ